jgi:formate C-acetyltransferase
LQAEHPLERAFLPIGGIKQAIAAAESYDFEIDPMINEIYSKYRKTHNQGVFDAYTPNMRKARHVHIITGLPDNYARGRIIGDYRRVALYGVDFLMKQKVSDWNKLDGEMSEEKIRLREELTEQYNAFIRMKKMALEYGFDISKPANTAKEAIQ